MLVTESAMGFNKGPLSLIDSLPSLNESTMSPIEVVVRRNDRFDKDLIKLEDFCAFAEENGIEDAGFAIAQICESNNINPVNIGFYVEETSIMVDESLAKTANLMLENGFRVFAAPISSDSIYCRALDEAMELDEDCEDFESSPNLMAYCEENIFEKASNKIGSGVDWAKNRASDRIRGAKDTLTKAPNELAKKYAAAKKKVAELSAKVSRTAGEAKAALLRQLDKAKAVMNALGKKLGVAKDTVVSNAKGAANFVADAASGAKKRVFG